jgi:hypothetical protein
MTRIMKTMLMAVLIVVLGVSLVVSQTAPPVLVGVFPEVVVLDPGDQVTWICDAGNLRIEFDVNRCPFGSNVFQAPIGMRLQTGPPRPGIKTGAYKYRLWINEQLVGRGEVLLRD